MRICLLYMCVLYDLVINVRVNFIFFYFFYCEKKKRTKTPHIMDRFTVSTSTEPSEKKQNHQRPSIYFVLDNRHGNGRHGLSEGSDFFFPFAASFRQKDLSIYKKF